MCGMIGLSSSTIASSASWRTARPCSLVSSNFASALSSSITAAIAVLNAWRRPKSSLTFWIVSCSWRRRVFWPASSAEGSVTA